MSGYIGTQPVPQATQKRQAFTATAGQTTFATSGYSVGFVDVYMNGVKLAAADYTATNGSDVVLATAALVNDIIEIVAFTSFVASGGLAAANNLSDVVSASTSRTNLGITLPNLGVTSTAAELNTLDAVPRGSIIYGNSSAATARLSKGATGTVLTAGADDISWVEASGGGEQTFTATGAITAGQIVGIIPDGTISTFSPYNGSLTSSTTTIGAQLNRCGITYDTNANKLVIASARSSNSPYYGYVQVCTIAADNTISIASEVALNSVGTYLARPAFDPATGRTNILYVTVQNNPQMPHAISGIVSGNSMTFGSAVTGPNESGDITDAGLIWLNVGSNKTLAVYRKNLGSGYRHVAYVVTTSGTSVSWGSVVVMDSATGSNQRGAVYDPDTNKVVIFYVVGSTSKCVVGTVSGTSISFGTAIDLSATVGFTGLSTMYPVYDTNANKVVFGFPDSANGNLPTVLVGTVSGTTISFGNPTVVNGLETCSTMGMAFNSDSNTVELNYTGSVSGAVIQTVKVSGTVVVAGPIRKIPNSQVVGNSGGMIYDPDTSRAVVVNGSAGAMVINPSAPTYVGIAKENISDGAAGAITVVGGINESQSSLITGFDYGLPTTGSAVAAGPANKIGKAISATKLYISEGSV